MPVDWGRQVYAGAELAGSADASGYATGALRLALHNPVRGEVDAAARGYTGRRTTVGLAPLPPVAYPNRYGHQLWPAKTSPMAVRRSSPGPVAPLPSARPPTPSATGTAGSVLVGLVVRDRVRGAARAVHPQELRQLGVRGRRGSPPRR
ncbi:hypothetical protein STENM327S_01517 [Streptomyces tendae]